MLIAIVHYHLRVGGVTRVIEHAVKSYQALGHECVLVVGEQTELDFSSTPVIVLPELMYSDSDEVHTSILALVNAEIQQKVNKLPDVWHIHNHSLGKNGTLPFLVHELSKSTTPLILQLHDFAEDGRSTNYRLLERCKKKTNFNLYPFRPGIQYAFLTYRDQAKLVSVGLPESYTVLLPNAVDMEGSTQKSSIKTEKKRIIYPTRAIRRKNVGEILLWAKIFPEFEFHITRAPQNPKEIPLYNEWVQCAQDQSLTNVVFESGKTVSVSFEEYLRSADYLITTSINEGFGLAYIEPNMLGCPLIGRNLAGVTSDFVKNGLQFPGLYNELPIPTEYFDFKGLLTRIRKKWAYLEDQYHVQLEKFDDTITVLDYGFLDEVAQKEVLAAFDIHLERKLKELLRPLFVQNEKQIQANVEISQNTYSLSVYKNRLTTIIQSITGERGVFSQGCINEKNVVNEFMKGLTTSLLKV